jgi:hypothetical protein
MKVRYTAEFEIETDAIGKENQDKEIQKIIFNRIVGFGVLSTKPGGSAQIVRISNVKRMEMRIG